MFNLIVAVVGIVLVAIIALLAMWFGGQAFSTSNEKATFAGYFNAGSQIFKISVTSSALSKP